MYNFQKDDETVATNEIIMPSDKYIPKSKSWTTSHPATEENTATAEGLNCEGPHWLVADGWAIPSDKIDSIFIKSYSVSVATVNEPQPRFKNYFRFAIVIRTISGEEYRYPVVYEHENEAIAGLHRLAKELAHPIGKYTRIVVGENVVVDD